MKYPLYWEDIGILHLKAKTKIIDLATNTTKYQEVKNLFNSTLPLAKVLKIQLIYNQRLWKLFRCEEEFFSQKL